MKTRVAILGGGCAGVSAAFHLSRTAAIRSRFEVTVYQMGHRLGGKGATGRDPDRAMRIEEHGLHLWMGFYQHAFSMMKECFDAWTPPDGCPMRTIDDAFAPQHRISFGGDGDPWHLTLPPRSGKPWDGPAERGGLPFPLRGEGRFASSLAAWRSLFRDVSRSPRATLRRAVTMSRLAGVVVRGLVADRVDRDGFESLNRYDLRAWLRRHGATDALADAPPIRAIYDLAFAYPDGVSGAGRGDIAAGAALSALLRIAFAYRGAPLWRMRFGMGDTVFTPLYQVLKERGVRFAFFHRTEELHTDDTGAHIEGVSMRQQARGVGGHYDPLITVKGLPAWPRRAVAERLATEVEDFEDPACQAGTMKQLRRGRDFDEVVLAIPVGALKSMTQQIAAHHPRFRQMLDSAKTVATCAAQMWLKPSFPELTGERSTVFTSHERPFSSWADMSDVLPAEDWRADHEPRSVVYFCDVCEDDTTPKQLRVRTEGWLDGHMARAWPGARDDQGGFDRGQLAVASGRPADDPVSEQYFRVNVAPSERYVTTPAGSVQHRLWPDESGVDNLTLAGDWTRSSIDGGSVEAAVESGMLAARAIESRRVPAPRGVSPARQIVPKTHEPRRRPHPGEHRSRT